MQIKSTYKFYDLYLLSAGILVLLFLTTHYLHKFRWLAPMVPFAIVIWLLLKHRFVRSISIQDHTLTVNYLQSFKKKTASYPVSALRFDLDGFNTAYKANNKNIQYNLSIFENNNKLWQLSTLEGFKRDDFFALLNYIQHL